MAPLRSRYRDWVLSIHSHEHEVVGLLVHVGTSCVVWLRPGFNIEVFESEKVVRIGRERGVVFREMSLHEGDREA